MSQLKASVHIFKKWFSLYITLTIILQIAGLTQLITGSVLAATYSSPYDGSDKSKFDFFYQWSNIDITATAWKILRKERYKHFSH